MDLPLYFGMPLLYWAYAKSATYQQKLFEIGYPAHPSIIEKRRKCINSCCFFAPSMIKNEIEYMHAKIDGISQESDMIEKGDENKFEKTFKTGNLGISLLKKDKPNGKEFKIIVEHGELYLSCIDSFEEIFEVKRDLVEKVELTNVLDPYMFDNHRDIVNAMFEVYFEMGEKYLNKFYDPKEGNKIKLEAQERVEKKYGIGKYNPTIVEQMATQEMQDTKKLLSESMR